MMRQYELVDRVAAYNPHVDEALLNRAYVYAMQKHGQQRRASGDPYFSHPLEVAAILTELRLDDATIATALLHDTIEDTDATRAEIDELFGKEIGALVDGLTKIDRLDLVSKQAEQAENLRKLLVAIADDVRVLLVKLADRLHNMRTLHHVADDKRRRIAEETMEIYAPLAGRMGMDDMRGELEDLAFRVLHPVAFETIATKREELIKRSHPQISAIKADLGRRLAENGVKAEIRGREKRPYSIFAKMQRKSVGFEQLSDIFGFRIIVEDIADCYRALGVVHTAWPMVPGRFKDYMSLPKQNDYRSLHTTIIGPERQRVELQIRTREMDLVAEYGIASHPFYKDGLSSDLKRLEKESRAYAWLQRTIRHIASGDAPEEFLENTKLELFQDQVFCFTPKGMLIALPRGATPIDFAYAVHTQIGDTCVGAKVNGQIAPLTESLRNGDEVEIIRTETQRPRPEWEALVVTGKARAGIRRATRDHVRRQYAGLGRHILKRGFEKADKSFDVDKLRPVLSRFKRGGIDDLLSDVGRGEVTVEAVLSAVYPDYRDSRSRANGPASSEPGWFRGARASLRLRRPTSRKQPRGERLPIGGLREDIPVRFAPDSGAVPGDRIVGILTQGEGVTIYPIQASALQEFEDEPDRWVDVRWSVDESSTERFRARIAVKAINEPGTLGVIADVLGRNDANIDNLKLGRKADDFTDILIDLEVWDLKHLSRVMAELRARSVVSDVKRLYG